MDNTCSEKPKFRTGLAALALCCGLVLAPSAHASQRRDFLVGPVTLGPGDTLVVTAANVEASRACLEAAHVQFIEHEIGDPTSADRAGIAVGDIGRSELGSARLAPGKSAKVRVRAGNRLGTKTVQVAVETERFVRGADPCINIGGTVLRWNGKAEAVSGVQSPTTSRSCGRARKRSASVPATATI